MTARLAADSLRRWLVRRVAEQTGIAESRIDVHKPLTELGLSSVDAVALTSELAGHIGADLPDTLAWEMPTISALATRLVTAQPQTTIPRPQPAATPIAVIGLGCRFPGGADDPEAYWQLLRSGGDGITELPPGRWTEYDHRELPRHGGFLTDVTGFDAEFFGITPREATLMDPQQRILLEVAISALEHAGLSAESVRGSQTGVFVGVSAHEYAHLTAASLEGIEAWTATGAAPSIIANRLSYLLDLRGPSMAIDTACSSSLVAVHQACRALADGEIDRAVVAGVNLLLTPVITKNFALAGALAPDGRCKAFDAAADGIVRGEGCGVVVLERLTDARRGGERILAVIRGSAVNSDGRSNGLMAPNPVAQLDLLHRACARADVDESTVDYVETHGTGTPLGDPIEAGALAASLGRGRTTDRPLLIGSVKTNIGHLEGAAGMAGLLKVVLAMLHDEIPPSLHFHEPNPRLNLAEHHLSVVAENQDWPRYSGQAIAGVSAFGFGGTNAHLVLEEWPQPTPRPAATPAITVLALADRSATRLHHAAARLADHLTTHDPDLADLAHTLVRRNSGPVRAAVVGRDRDELAAGLRDLVTVQSTAAERGVVWVFSGFGSQYPGMARGLLATEPAFAAEITALEPIFRAEAGFSLINALHEDGGDLYRAQLRLLGVQLGLAALWRSAGVEPAAVLGHSMGEVAAAAAAGALEVADAVRVMAVRARLLTGVDASGAGAMAVIGLSEAEFAALDFPGVEVAVYASPRQLTVTGPAEQVRALVAQLTDNGVLARLLKVGGAGHSAAVEPLLNQLRAELADIRPSHPEIPCYSTVAADEPAFDAAYWAANLRRPVRFCSAVNRAFRDGFRAFVEISPHPVVTLPIEESVADDTVVIGTLRREADDAITFATNLGALYTHGHPTALASTSAAGHLVDLPTRTWQHRPYWFAAHPDELDIPAPRQLSVLERLRGQIAEIAGYRLTDIDEHRPLTTLGLDSLMAQRLRNAVERDFARPLPIQPLLRGATLAEVADLLTEPDSPLRTLREGDGSTPLFLFHAAGGPTCVYRPLVAGLPGRLTCYGLERLDDVTDVPDRARRYVEVLRATWPGPYRLGGWSFGGCLAIEVAQQLTGAGATVELVALIDSILPRPDHDGQLARYRRFAAHLERTYGRTLDVPWSRLAALDEDAQFHALLDIVKRADLDEAVVRHQYMSHVDTRAAERYRPHKYSGQVLLYRAAEPHALTVTLDPRYLRTDRDLGWAEFCPNLEVIDVPGDHLTIIDPPNVSRITEHLGDLW